MTKRVSIIGSSAAASVVPGWNDYEFARFEREFLNEGVISGFAVSQFSGGANLSVDVALGLAVIEITNTNVSHAKTYKVYFSSDATETIEVEAADVTNPRIDRLILEVDVTTNPNANASNIATIRIVKGVAAGSPAAPSEPSNAITLALISVPAGDTTISTGQITDSRTYASMKSAVLPELCRQGLANNAATVGGTSDVITLTSSPVRAAYATSSLIWFIATGTNTTSVTANVDGLGAKTLKKWSAGTLANLTAGDLVNGLPVVLYYDGTYLIVISPLAPGAASGTVSVADKTASYTVVSGDAGKMMTNNGTTTPVDFTLPTSNQGLSFELCCLDTDGIVLLPSSSDTIDDGTTTGLVGYYSQTLTSTARLLKVTSTKWVVTQKSGTWATFIPKGFILGGDEAGGKVATVETLKFSDDTRSTAANNLTAARYSGFGVQGLIGVGYYAGGYNSGGTVQSTIYKMNMLAESFSTLGGALSAARAAESARGMSSSTKGYAVAGYTGSSSAVVDAITFATDGLATITSLAVAKQSGAVHQSSSAGYYCGGSTGGTVQYKLTFSGESWSTLGGALPVSRSECGACHSTLAGYYAGANAAVNTIAKFTNASDTSATLAATLSDTRMRMAGFQKSTDGYYCGGFKAARVATIDKINFGADTISTPAATLGAARDGVAGLSNSGLGV